MIEVRIPIYYNVNKKKAVLAGLNWYRNAHFQVTAKVKKFVTGIIDDNIEGEPVLEGKVHVHFKVYLKRKGSDGGNVRAVMEKFALDGIVKAGMLKDDTAEIIVTDSSEYHYDKDFPRCEITIFDKEKDKEELGKALLSLQ